MAGIAGVDKGTENVKSQHKITTGEKSFLHQNNNRGKCHIGIKIKTRENVILASK